MSDELTGAARYFPTYGEALATHARECPDQIALRYSDRTTTYRDFDRHATQIANGLAALGIAKGDRIAYFGKNSDHAVELALGAARAGVVFVPIIWRLAPAEVENCLQHRNVDRCLFPLRRPGQHELRSGSTEAIRHFGHLLERHGERLARVED